MTNGVEGGLRVISPDDWGAPIPVIRGIGECREVVGALLGCSLRSLYHFTLGQLSETVSMRHAAEAVYYVIEGSVELSAGGSVAGDLGEGHMFHIPAGVTYSFATVSGATVLGGPSPVDPDFGSGGDLNEDPAEGGVQICHRDRPGLMVPFISNDARLVVWYGIGAVGANMNYVVLEPGERNKEHVHAYSEDTIFILEGHGTAEDVTHGVQVRFGPGDTVTIPPKVWHAVVADQGERVVSVGGPCPADLDMLRAVGVDVDALSAQLPGRSPLP